MGGMKGLLISTFWILTLSTLIQFTKASVLDEKDDLMETIKGVTKLMKPLAEIHINDQFQIFCRIGEKKYLIYYFRTATLRITSSAEDIKLIKGHNPRDVYFQYTHSTKWLLWIANVLPWRVRDTNYPTFNTSCVGISTSKPYSAMLIIRPIDPWKVLTLLGGIALFFMAPQLSQSTLFFYSSGTFLGALAAALVLLFIVTRFLPKGRSGYFAISVLWTLAFYYAGETWKHFEELLHQRLPYIVSYLFCGALIAFLACYRWGPPTHPRTVDIIRWALQIGGLVLIHFSSDFVELSTAIILIVLSYHQFSAPVKYFMERYYRRWFPPKAYLLSEEEYMTQGVVETQKGLEQLRSFCSSPESTPWKLVSRLKDPRRFSSFMEGGSHLNDDEILSYESNDSPINTHNRSRIAPQGRMSISYTSSRANGLRASLPPMSTSQQQNQNQTREDLMTDDDTEEEEQLHFDETDDDSS